MNGIHTPLLVMAALAFTGCASSERSAVSGLSPGNDCFFASTLSDWRPLDDENLILFASGRTPYHVELVRPAFGLGFDFMIGIYDRDGRICPYGGDAIIVDGGGGMPERISIRSMKRLSEAELDQLYVDYGIAPPPVVDEFEELSNPDGAVD